MKKILLILAAALLLPVAAALAANPVISVNQFVEHPALERLVTSYGTEYNRVLQIIRDEPSLGECLSRSC